MLKKVSWSFEGGLKVYLVIVTKRLLMIFNILNFPYVGNGGLINQYKVDRFSGFH